MSASPPIGTTGWWPNSSLDWALGCCSAHYPYICPRFLLPSSGVSSSMYTVCRFVPWPAIITPAERDFLVEVSSLASRTSHLTLHCSVGIYLSRLPKRKVSRHRISSSVRRRRYAWLASSRCWAPVYPTTVGYPCQDAPVSQ